jgi:hypothetical protein
MERCYVIVWELEDSPETGIECVTLSLAQAEQMCLDLEAANAGKIYYWIPSFLEPNI